MLRSLCAFVCVTGLCVLPVSADDVAELDALLCELPDEMSVYDPHAVPGQPKGKFLLDLKHKFIGPGKISDVRSARPIEFMGKEYFTRDAKEATLGSIGTLDKGLDRLSSSDDSFERFGFDAPDFQVTANKVNGHIEMNGRSLASFTGSANFEMYAKLNLKKALLKRKKKYKVSFVAADLIAKDVILALNKEPEVSQFLSQCKRRRKTPVIVMSNVIMLDTNATEAMDAGAELEVTTIIDTDNQLSAKVNQDNTETIILTSPIIRCYEMFEILSESTAGRMEVIGLERHRP